MGSILPVRRDVAAQVEYLWVPGSFLEQVRGRPLYLSLPASLSSSESLPRSLPLSLH
jgi:hypothetical protein